MKNVVELCQNHILGTPECKGCLTDDYNRSCPNFKPIRIYTFSNEMREMMQHALDRSIKEAEEQNKDRERILNKYASVMGDIPLPYNSITENS